MATYKDVLFLVDNVTKPLAKIALKMRETQRKSEKLTGVVGKLQRRMNYVGKTFTEAGNRMKAAGNKISNIVGKLGLSFGVMSAAVGMAFNKLQGWFTSTAQYGDRIDKMSQKIGMSTQSFQEWDFIMSQNGSSVETLQMGYKTLANQMNGVQKGSKESIKAFAALGVKVKDNTGKFRTQDEVFNDVVRALQKETNATKKAILGNQLFGRSFIEMKPLLNQTAESIDDLRKQAQDTIISEEDIKNSVKFTDAMDKFTRIFQAKMAPVVTRVMPKVIEIMDKMLARTDIIEKVINLIVYLTDKLIGLVDWFMGLSKSCKIAIAAVVGLVTIIGPLLTFVGNLMLGFGQLLPILTEFGLTTGPAAAAALGTIASTAIAATGAIMGLLFAFIKIKAELDAWGDSTKGMDEKLKINNLATDKLNNKGLERLQEQRKLMGAKNFDKKNPELAAILNQAEKQGRVSKITDLSPRTTNNDNRNYTYNTTNNYGQNYGLSPLTAPQFVVGR